MSFDYYRDRVLRKGSTNQDRILYEKKRSFDEYLTETPTSQKVVINGEDYLVSIQDVKFNDLYQQDKYMLTHIDLPIKVGDYVEWDNEIWMILTKENENIKDHQSHRISKTTHSMKWIDDKGNLIVKPAITSAKTLYTTGIKDEKVIEIPNGMQGIQFPYDSDTKKLDRGHGFVFNKAKYELTFYDETSFPKLIVLICTEIGTSHLDDKVNEIADRWIQVGNEKIDRLPWLDNQLPPEEPEPPQEPIAGVRYTLSIETPFQDDDPNELWYGETYKYIVHKFVDDVEVSGNFTFALSDTTKATLSNINSSNCKVTAKDIKGNHIIKLTVTDTDTSVVAIEQEIKIIGR